ncbi:tRNA (uracil(54)-C(5))-methyltransferase homolog isoform X2 [Coturnix japonica]|uniref:tRNA (uracil(54)-C(5))-methyltransferase homolog isoform X2 n=1 Tax=Coturnix japonica TaxID=93934 RepID=UPI000777E828|nr:tRNA (uracil(54)-C(5))-methyltransferase homolog isoform X2 [Coturnix japonica]
MALPHASMLTRWCLRLLTTQPMFLSSMPGWDCRQPTGERAAKRRRKKGTEGCSLPASSWEERLADAATPLWRLPYQEQLQVKYERLREVLQTLTSHLEELGGGVQDPSGLCCPLQPVVPSPTVNGYRNKSTFSVNRGPDGNPKTVGLYVGTGRARNIVCVRTAHMKNIPQKHTQVAQCYEQFIRRSPLDSCILFHEGGHWRELVVRTSQHGHTMAIVTFHPQQLGQEALAAQKELLREFFTHGPGAACALTSLYFQESTMTRCSHEQSPFQLLHGEPHIFEDVLGLTFRISPDAFFQVNTSGAEVLYQAVRELSQAAGDTVLLDVCCGTGTIGLSLARHVSKVIGVEIVQKAIEDARWNAAFNGISNCEFHSGKAEVVLPALLSSWEDARPLVAVVNPSRAGIHHRVVKAIRSCGAIRRLLYISCKPEGEAMRNFLQLCCPADPGKKLEGDPFAPALAVPFDMFPHTAHCELVLLLTR